LLPSALSYPAYLQSSSRSLGFGSPQTHLKLDQAIFSPHERRCSYALPEQLPWPPSARGSADPPVGVKPSLPPVGLRRGRNPRTRSETGTRFESLLAAMWLQMMWLLTAGNNVRRCSFCGKIITFETPKRPEDPGTGKPASRKYKTRVDRMYCSHNCAAKASYHRKKRARERRTPDPS
jgi:hypothetical protein